MENIIEEMALTMCGREGCKTCTHFIEATKCAAVVSAKKLYNAGYRKQKEGEWIYVHTYMRGRCSICNAQMQYDNQPFCSNCGAHMKGASNDRK